MPALEDVPYHSPDVPYVDGVAPWGLKHDLGRAVDIRLRIVVSFQLPVHDGAEVAEDDSSKVVREAKASRLIDGGAVDVLSGRGALYLVLNKCFEDPLVHDCVQDVVCLDIYVPSSEVGTVLRKLLQRTGMNELALGM